MAELILKNKAASTHCWIVHYYYNNHLQLVFPNVDKTIQLQIMTTAPMASGCSLTISLENAPRLCFNTIPLQESGATLERLKIC